MNILGAIHTILRHRWRDDIVARRAFDPALIERLQRRVGASERRHSGEIRICIEASLPWSYLWRHLAQGRPLRQVVRERAVMMFGKLRVWDTEHNNGVLIYLLVAEHAIEVVADRGFNAHVSPVQWQAMVQRLGEALRQARYEEGLTQALEEVSAVLVEHFPDDPTPSVPGDHPDAGLPNRPVVL